MKIEQIFCPSCGASIKGDISGDSIICPYCGQQLSINHERKEVVITKNYNYKKEETKRYINDADLAKAGTEHYKAQKTLNWKRKNSQSLYKIIGFWF